MTSAETKFLRQLHFPKEAQIGINLHNNRTTNNSVEMIRKVSKIRLTLVVT